MMLKPLSLLDEGEEGRVVEIRGRRKKRLLELGFTRGSKVRVLFRASTLLVDVKNSRIALGKELASEIMVQR